MTLRSVSCFLGVDSNCPLRTAQLPESGRKVGREGRKENPSAKYLNEQGHYPSTVRKTPLTGENANALVSSRALLVVG